MICAESAAGCKSPVASLGALEASTCQPVKRQAKRLVRLVGLQPAFPSPDCLALLYKCSRRACETTFRTRLEKPEHQSSKSQLCLRMRTVRLIVELLATRTPSHLLGGALPSTAASSENMPSGSGFDAQRH